MIRSGKSRLQPGIITASSATFQKSEVGKAVWVTPVLQNMMEWLLWLLLISSICHVVMHGRCRISEKGRIIGPIEVRISSDAPADALSLQAHLCKKLQPFLPTVLVQLAFFDCLTHDSLFLPPLLAEFTKFQNDIAVELQLHADAFASAKITFASPIIR
jgi:hypothetical protein